MVDDVCKVKVVVVTTALTGSTNVNVGSTVNVTIERRARNFTF
jgi:hypothetical protein